MRGPSAGASGGRDRGLIGSRGALGAGSGHRCVRGRRFGEHHPEHVVAGAAVGADAAALQVADGIRPRLDGAGNVAVALSTADTDDHEQAFLESDLETESQ